MGATLERRRKALSLMISVMQPCCSPPGFAWMDFQAGAGWPGLLVSDGHDDGVGEVQRVAAAGGHP